jgi:hypothetical protein
VLTFVTTVRHPKNSRDYSRVEGLLKDTVASMCGQTRGDFSVVVVGNQRPSFDLPPQARFVGVDFPPPSDLPGPQTGREPVLADKGTKLAVGLLAARELAPTHVMAVDADDFVSNRLAGLVADHPGANGWFVADGYKISLTSGLIRPVDGDFNFRCGTSHVVRFDLLDVPDLPVDATQEQIWGSFGRFMVRDLLGSHHAIAKHLEEHGTPLAPLPSAGRSTRSTAARTTRVCRSTTSRSLPGAPSRGSSG